ncbi:MAG: metallophosphoesterase family protein [Deltaproteobacteria bacterium]|nr:metallophosphoesterase family protein [Deltaproteobacteria bacterium]
MAYARKSAWGGGAPLLEKQASVPCRADGGLRLVVVADTHSQPHPNSAALIASHKPEAILHAGDIGDLDVLEQLAQIAPVLAVRGNIDGHAPSLPDHLAIDLGAGEGEAPLARLLLLHIGVNGPKLRADAARAATQKHAQIVVCGHSHVPFIGVDKGLTIFNPGSIGPRRFALPIAFGVLELTPAQLRLWHVDCETGAKWMPP